MSYLINNGNMIMNVTILPTASMITVYSNMIIGAIVGIISAIFTGYFLENYKKNLEDKRTKKYIMRGLLSELEENQKFLCRIIEENKTITDIAKLPLGDIPIIKAPNIYFGRDVYLSLLDKIGLLQDETIDRLVRYYTVLHMLENIYDRIISPLESEHIEKDEIKEMEKAIKGRWKDDYFKYTNEAYGIGNKLENDLNTAKI